MRPPILEPLATCFPSLESSIKFSDQHLAETTAMKTTASESRIYIPRTNSDRKKLSGCCLRWGQIKGAYEQSNGVESWRKLQPKCHYRKGRLVCTWQKDRSAFELATAWENAKHNLPPEINALFGSSAELLVATPEHTTPLAGKGRTSQTDVLAFVRANGKEWFVAVEGKVNEGFGDIACKWLKKGNLANRKARLNYILCQLGLSYREVKDIRYQLLHRTACAVIEAKRFDVHCAAMVVHSFSCQQKGFGDFEKFLNVLKTEKPVTVGKLYKVTKRDIPSGISLSLGWTNSRYVSPTRHRY